jgi:hypothetical protein
VRETKAGTWAWPKKVVRTLVCANDIAVKVGARPYQPDFTGGSIRRQKLAAAGDVQKDFGALDGSQLSERVLPYAR